MHNKRLKLKVQNAALLEDGQGRPQIFKNLRIYVSLTSPSRFLTSSALIALTSRPSRSTGSPSRSPSPNSPNFSFGTAANTFRTSTRRASSRTSSRPT